MAAYPHLKLPYKIEGLAKPPYGGGKTLFPQTEENKKNRQVHGKNLQNQIGSLRNTWDEFRRFKSQGQSSLPNEIDIPIFLKIDPNSFNDVETFRHWGVEIISQEEDGFLLGVSNDGFKKFEENLLQFLAETGRYKDTAAKIWEIADNEGRIQRLLKGDLKDIWGSIQDDEVYTVEVGVYCYVMNLLEYPERSEFDDQEEFEQKIDKYNKEERELQIQRDLLQIQREDEINKYVTDYGAKLQDEWDNSVDAVFFKISIVGNGLRDLIFTYPYLFKVSFPSTYQIEEQTSIIPLNEEVEVLPPSENAPAVCVIDSGIQENHRLLAPSINSNESISYVNADSSTSDFVRLSGHGTKVAGAILYPREIPVNGVYQLTNRIQNARILNRDNRISDEEFGPALMNKIVANFPNTRIFNLSVADGPYLGSHMHELAESIDNLTHQKNILFIIAAGNLFELTGSFIKPGVSEFFQLGIAYPDYLENENCRIANPGISSFALTVGSVGHIDYEDVDVEAIAGKDYVSPFSRNGFGMWGAIKPDVVEYGGDLIQNKTSLRVSPHKETCIELVNSTLYGAASSGKESYGTSYSAPKVSHIVAQLQAEHPGGSSQMYRALIVQSARLPAHCFGNPTTRDFARYGYGIPDLGRALNNAPNRITFIQQGNLGGKKADIYKLVIPNELRGEKEGFQILVEVTLAFTAKTRATRKGAHSYLSTWLEWKSSRYGENFNSFRARTLEYLEQDLEQNGEAESGDKAIQWVIRENPNWSSNVKINRNNSTVQKSWAIISPHQFGEDFSLAIIGHVGWDKNQQNTVPYALTVSFESVGTELPIYELMSRAQIPEISTEVEVEE